ncbi:Ubiquinone biosynthesis monooxygenase COQ6, mitochondrial [Hanseniaspora osmophila]|uniref:Ubiquinone biosynthesis monooxygenase COQ6, mitochondrial n=1 Tax=Hanseniaspora osmophila TaxID=56408 RepID=A0A1E5RGN2_9ASCO|nr:Ubiquinone biosynthesis monooxygenase COQ6, mitochondrial [Hanseniaspora osmophila]
MFSRFSTALSFRQASLRVAKQHRKLYSTEVKQVQDKILTDILIVGGGPAGLTLASAIKSSPLLKHYKTTLVDATPISSSLPTFYEKASSDEQFPFTNRVVSITPRNMDFLTADLNLPLMFNRIQPFDGICISDGLSDFNTLTMDRDSMGYMVELLNLQSSAHQKILELNEKFIDPNEKIQIIDNCKVLDIKSPTVEDNAETNLCSDAWPEVELDNGQIFKTRLLIGCDGFNSPVRKFANIDSLGWFYNKWGVVATMKLECPPFSQIRGWQRFLPTGPIAHLPLPNDNATLVWSTTPELSQLLTKVPAPVFAKLVNAAFLLEDGDMQYYYNKLRQVNDLSNENDPIYSEMIEDINYRMEDKSEHITKFYGKNDMYFLEENYPPTVVDIQDKSRARFPMKMFHCNTYVAPRVALVGDAAHATHPLAGQGLNMGLGDSMSLVKALEQASSRGLDLGQTDFVLNEYWKERYGTNMMLLGITDKLHKLYGSSNPIVTTARQFGVSVLNNIGGLKSLMMNIVSGPK